jgi:hypothetical protein
MSRFIENGETKPLYLRLPELILTAGRIPLDEMIAPVLDPGRFARDRLIAALERITALYAIDKTTRGMRADERRRVRQDKS